MEVTILTWTVAITGLLLGMWPLFGVLEGIYCFARLMD